MITVSSGLINSLIILEYLRNDESLKDISINVGAFTNCREVGLTFCVMSAIEKGEYVVIEPFTWCIYEHRNSDQIIINGINKYVNLNGDLPYNPGNKNDYLRAFPYNEHMSAAQWLSDSIKGHAALSILKTKTT